MLFDNILQVVGKTPMVRLNRVGAQLACRLYAKCEFLNPGGSLKDRIGRSMVEAAEAEGRIKPGDTLIEPTSGNTGIGIALAGAVRGYRVIITMPEKMSREKQVVLEALGAEIIRTPTEAAYDSPESHISVARRLQSELPNAHILDQYSNPNNPRVHYQETAQEILDDLDGRVDMVVMGAGTGGSITGVARRIKEVCPHCLIIGADPVGSILGGGTEVGTYKVEGIGYDFIPAVLERELVDEWVKTTDRHSFLLARRLIREEGLLVGGSSGAVLYAALQKAPKLKAGQNCVVVLPDGVRNYMTKFVDNKWMRDNGFFESPALTGKVGDLLAQHGPRPALICAEDVQTLREVVAVMRQQGISQLPVTSGGVLVGMISESDLMEFLASGAGDANALVSRCMNRQVAVVGPHTPLATLQESLRQSNAVVVVDNARKPLSILTRIDLLDYLARTSGEDEPVRH
ncbi:MAG: cystathionine beta-synthase [candidate division KSB1 bacterium]|nr:cystathionine beta-synthase [candidate division KSB1 bacterium]MDZ7273375.1 cystathionine beta-synthase [candidate division KSB1 bacterium]MDZ7288037.1 cystathionine beta-synthase [candidate division KSB1 bacterium]MDZ7300111.1 cystathionine beta-synthase [candidate division KSB1 bacterium]MDZ7308936.1 cystathionine beta-synthase [candidate division KSB1 bacterium]